MIRVTSEERDNSDDFNQVHNFSNERLTLHQYQPPSLQKLMSWKTSSPKYIASNGHTKDFIFRLPRQHETTTTEKNLIMPNNDYNLNEAVKTAFEQFTNRDLQR